MLLSLLRLISSHKIPSSSEYSVSSRRIHPLFVEFRRPQSNPIGYLELGHCERSWLLLNGVSVIVTRVNNAVSASGVRLRAIT
jgi:hypothetical protein